MNTQVESRIVPKYLNWKCFDNFDKVPNKKIFLIGEMEITPYKRAVLKRACAQLKAKWEPKLRDLFKEPEKTHLEIAGGNYTFFFVLPHAIKWIRARNPFLQVSISLFELGGAVGLSDQSADIILTSRADVKLNDKYIATRKYHADAMLFAASADAVSVFGSKQDVLSSHDVLFGRTYTSHLYDTEKIPLYSTIPNGRQVRPRVIVDQYFLKFILMKHSVGIGHVHRSMRIDSLISVLSDEAIVYNNRFCLLKKGLESNCKLISRRLINSMQYGEIK